MPISFSLSMVEDQQNAVLARLISAWSYQFTLPRLDDTVDPATGVKTYEDSLKRLPLDDWDEVEEAVSPIMDKLRSAGPKGKTGPSSNGSSKAKGTTTPVP